MPNENALMGVVVILDIGRYVYVGDAATNSKGGKSVPRSVLGGGAYDDFLCHKTL